MMMLFEKGVITIIRKIREESEGWQIDFASLSYLIIINNMYI